MVTNLGAGHQQPARFCVIDLGVPPENLLKQSGRLAEHVYQRRRLPFFNGLVELSQLQKGTQSSHAGLASQ